MSRLRWLQQLCWGGYQTLEKNLQASPEQIEEKYQTALKEYHKSKESLEDQLAVAEQRKAKAEADIENSLHMQIDPNNEYVAFMYMAISDLDTDRLQQVFGEQDILEKYLTEKS